MLQQLNVKVQLEFQNFEVKCTFNEFDFTVFTIESLTYETSKFCSFFKALTSDVIIQKVDMPDYLLNLLVYIKINLDHVKNLHLLNHFPNLKTVIVYNFEWNSSIFLPQTRSFAANAQLCFDDNLTRNLHKSFINLKFLEIGCNFLIQRNELPKNIKIAIPKGCCYLDIPFELLEAFEQNNWVTHLRVYINEYTNFSLLDLNKISTNLCFVKLYFASSAKLENYESFLTQFSKFVNTQKYLQVLRVNSDEHYNSDEHCFITATENWVKTFQNEQTMNLGDQFQFMEVRTLMDILFVTPSSISRDVLKSSPFFPAELVNERNMKVMTLPSDNGCGNQYTVCSFVPIF